MAHPGTAFRVLQQSSARDIKVIAPRRLQPLLTTDI